MRSYILYVGNSVWDDEEVQKMHSDDGSITMRIYQTPLNSILSNGRYSKFYVMDILP